MKIERVEDIFIPTKEIRIGTGWDDEVRPFLKNYADFIGDDTSIATTEDELDKCESDLNTSLPEDLRLFYKTFGPAKLEAGLFNVTDFHYLTKDWTNQFLDNYSNDEQRVLSKLIVFGEYLGMEMYGVFTLTPRTFFITSMTVGQTSTECLKRLDNIFSH